LKFKGAKIDKRKIQVKGGFAWTETVKFRKRKPWRTSWLQKDSDGVIRKKKRVDFIKGFQTGYCPECNQMPCHHTAKLLGWKD